MLGVSQARGSARVELEHDPVRCLVVGAALAIEQRAQRSLVRSVTDHDRVTHFFEEGSLESVWPRVMACVDEMQAIGRIFVTEMTRTSARLGDDFGREMGVRNRVGPGQPRRLSR